MWSFIRDSGVYSFYALGIFALLFFVAIPIGTVYLHPMWEPDDRLVGYVVGIVLLASLASAIRHRKSFLVSPETSSTTELSRS